MPRIARIQKAGDRHHITNRASLKRSVFLDDDDRRAFLRILRQFKSRFDVDVEAFCLMTTHYHLVLACPVDDMAKAMHRLGFLYTQYFNERHGADGALFSDRFYSRPILDERYHRNAVRYVHRNPLAMDKNMDLARYQWSSHGAYLGERPVDFVNPESTLELFGGSQKVFRDFVQDQANDMCGPDLAQLQDVVDVVTSSLPQATGAQQQVVRQTKRQLVCVVAADHLSQTSGTVAATLSLSASGVRSQTSRARGRLRQDPLFAELRSAVIDKLGPAADMPAWWDS